MGGSFTAAALGQQPKLFRQAGTNQLFDLVRESSRLHLECPTTESPPLTIEASFSRPSLFAPSLPTPLTVMLVVVYNPPG